MIRHKRLIRARQHEKLAKSEKPKTKWCFGVLKQYNEKTGKYDIDV